MIPILYSISNLEYFHEKYLLNDIYSTSTLKTILDGEEIELNDISYYF